MKKLKINDGIANLILVIIFRLTLDISYILGISKIFTSDGFFLEYDVLRLMESYILMCVIFMFIPKDNQKITSIIMHILYCIIIIPTTSLFSLSSFYQTRAPLYIYSIGFILSLIIIKGARQKKLTKIKEGHFILFTLIFLLTIISVGMMFLLNGLPSFQAFDLLKVYDVRETAKYNFVLNYTLNWQVNVINTFLIVFSLIYKKYKLLILSIIIQLYLFLTAAHKTYLFSILLVIGLTWFIGKSKNLVKDLLKSLITINILVLSFYLISGNYIPLAIITRRVFFIPAQISYFYYDFFSNNELLYFSEGIIGKIINRSSPYSMRVVNMIAGLYYNQPGMASNTGYLSDAYANAGVIGVMVISILMGMILRIIEALSVDMRVTISVTIMPVFSLINGALLTTILTNGLMISIIILYLYKEYRSRNFRKLPSTAGDDLLEYSIHNT